MASTCQDVCKAVSDFHKTLPPESISFPVGITETVIPHLEKQLSVKGNFKINYSSKSWGSKNLKGMLLRYDDHAKIVYSNSLNTCWRRFVLCKEIAHLLIDTGAKCFTHDPYELVQQLINQAPSLNSHDMVKSEHLAAIGAIEILFPWKLRSKMETMRKDSSMSDLQIAQTVRAPQTAVSYLLRSKYWAISEECHTSCGSI